MIRSILLILAILGFFSWSFAQQVTESISGQVLDGSANPVANVVVESSTNGKKTLTDASGYFVLNVPNVDLERLSFTKEGYEAFSVGVAEWDFSTEPIVLVEVPFFVVDNEVELPYQTLHTNRNVSAISTISGEELTSYPSLSFLDALSGRLPGLVIDQYDYTPGAENIAANVRGLGATFYIDGVLRNPVHLTTFEVEKVEVIKDLSGRAMLGINGAGPVIWITTKEGKTDGNEINFSVETGLSEPMVLPNYLDSYNYASLYNEALENDGLNPLYSQEALNAYQSGSDPVRYPNIDYYDRYVKEYTNFTRANINFRGGNEGVSYFSMLDYSGNGGYEAIGQETTYDRYKIRANVNLKVNDYIKMNVNLNGTYGQAEYPNAGGGAGRYNLFNILSSYPSNASPIIYDGNYIISDNYPVNLDNELLYGGYAESTELGTQNNVSLLIDLGSVLEGLDFNATAAFDANNVLTTNKGGTEHLYRLTSAAGAPIVERMVERSVETSMWAGSDYYERSISALASLNYDRTFGRHELTINSSYYQGIEEARATFPNYQPNKIQDLGLRGNYAFDKKYVVQFDLAYTGNMRLPDGERFNAYPTVGGAWNISEESFLQNNRLINHLKLHASYGVMGINSFNLPGNYNQYYLQRTLWQSAGSWTTGIEGQRSGANPLYQVLQYGSNNFSLPERTYFNIGLQTELFNRSLAFEANYFAQNDSEILSQMSNFTPSLYGTGGFLPATNFGENKAYGFDGLMQFSNSLGDVDFSVGANAQYLRRKNVIVDEPAALPEYRQRAGKDADLFWLYQAEGLYQSEEEINSRNVSQSWGAVQPGDIRYRDFNNDGVVNEQDVFATGAHSPRIAYGLNLSLKYKGFGLFVLAKGVADGEVMLNNSYFFNNSTVNNYSEVMLNRWPETNDYPRLTTTSQNNYQSSTFWLANAAYLNVKNVQLSYSLPNSFLSNLNIQDLNFFVRGKNLLMLSDLKREYNLNPELLNSGISSYPMSRTVTLGLRTKF